MPAVSEKELLLIDELLVGVDRNAAAAMSHVRRSHSYSFQQLSEKMVGISPQMLKRYMQQSYHGIRPIHLCAAFSWVSMVPMTTFYYGLKLTESFRGMDQFSVSALVFIGRLPTQQFLNVIEIIKSFLTDDDAQKITLLIDNAIESGDLGETVEFCPPEPLDVEKFGDDYYRSIAIALVKFRKDHSVSKETIARVLGISLYQYNLLEDQEKRVNLSLSIGLRVKCGFRIDSHTDFTKEMTEYSDFHKLRRVQQTRDVLIVSSMQMLPESKKTHIIEILRHLSAAYS